MYTTTLKTLRKNQACYEGYNKLVCFLQNREFTTEDENREYYLRCNHTEVIPVATIVESNGIADALWVISNAVVDDRSVVNNSNRMRDIRLFAVWCARQVEHLMTDQRSRDALDVAEAFANGEATEAELRVAYDAAYAAVSAAYAAYAAYEAAAYAAAYAAADAAYAAADAAYAAADAAEAADAQKEMLIKVCNGTAPWQVI